AFLLVNYIYIVTIGLDKNFDWKNHTTKRLGWQVLLGFAIPALGAFLLAALFFAVNRMNILQTTYLDQDYTIILIMLLIVNLYYFGLNSFLLRDEPSKETDNNNGASKEVIVVDTPLRSVPVKTLSIRYLYLLEGHVFLRTEEITSLSDSLQISGNLKKYEKILDSQQFFRINRQVIVSFDACGSFTPGKNKTLVLTLNPPPYPNGNPVPKEHERLCVVSEDRVAAFRQWIKRKLLLHPVAE